MTDSTPLRESLMAGLEALQAGEFGAVIETLEPVANAASQSGDSEAEVAARSALAQAYMLAGRYPDALQQAHRGLAVAETHKVTGAIPQLQKLAEMAGDEPPESQLVAKLNARIQVVIPGIQRGEEDAIEALRAICRDATTAVLPGPEATARGLLGQALLHVKRRGEAEPELYRALALSEELGNDDAAAHFRELLAPTDEPEGIPPEIIESEKRLQGAVEMARSGHPQKALEEARAVLDASRAAGIQGMEASARGLIAQILLNVGMAAEALTHAKLALALAETGGATEAAVHFRDLVQAADIAANPDHSGAALNRDIHELVLKLQGGELESAVAGLEAVVEAAVADDAAGPEATARGVLAQVMMRLGRVDQALIHARRALDLADEGGAEEAANQLRALVSQLENAPIGEA